MTSAAMPLGNPGIQPDTATMQSFIDRLFSSSGMRGLVELSWTEPQAPHRLNRAKMFDLADTDELVEEGARINATPNCNLYISAGLRKPEVAQLGRAMDADVFACVALWADFDAPGALDEALKKVIAAGMPPTLIVYTGTHPHLRGQMWWVLEEPCEDLTRHAQLQKALARWLGGDKVVFNPSRVMRFPGSVAWPMKAGRQLEMTGFHEGETRIEQYTLEELTNKILANAPGEQQQTTAQIFDFNDAPAQLDLDDLVKLARVPHRWHEAALKATARMLALGTPAAAVVELLTPMLQQPGYTHIQTRQQLGTMVNGGLKKGYLRDAQDLGDECHIAPDQQLGPPIDLHDFLEMRIPARKLLLSPWLAEKGLAMIVAPRGIGKTYVALNVGYAVASGGSFLGWKAEAPRRVVYIDGEMPADALQERLASIAKDAEVPAARGAFQLLAADQCEFGLPDLARPDGQRILRPLLEPYDLIILDNLSTLCRSGRENEAESWALVQAFALELRRAGKSVLFIHHAGKNGQQRGTSKREDVLDTVISLKRPDDYSPTEGARFVVQFDKTRGFTGSDAEAFEAALDPHTGLWSVKAATCSRDAEVMSLHDAGFSLASISKELGIPKTTVHRIVQRMQELRAKPA